MTTATQPCRKDGGTETQNSPVIHLQNIDERIPVQIRHSIRSFSEKLFPTNTMLEAVKQAWQL